MVQTPSYPTINLFKNKRCKGWWPVWATEVMENNDDDDDADDDEEEEIVCMVLKVIT